MTEQLSRVVRANRRVAELIGRHQLVAPDVLAGLLREANTTGRELMGVLVARGITPHGKLLESLAEHIGIEYWGGDPATVQDTAVQLLPQDVSRHHQAVPLRFDGRQLVVAVADPFNVEKQTAISEASGQQVEMALMRADHISPVLDAVYAAPAEIQSHGASGLQIDAMLA